MPAKRQPTKGTNGKRSEHDDSRSRSGDSDLVDGDEQERQVLASFIVDEVTKQMRGLPERLSGAIAG